MPLKGIPSVLSPDLLHVLASAGHGDDIVIGDTNFPTASTCGHGPRQIRLDGQSNPELLKAILKLFPLDQYVDAPVALMDRVDNDKKRGLKVPVWPTYQQIINEAEGKEVQIEYVERFQFYERAKKAYAVIHTGETALYGCMIIKKGVISV